MSARCDTLVENLWASFGPLIGSAAAPSAGRGPDRVGGDLGLVALVVVLGGLCAVLLAVAVRRGRADSPAGPVASGRLWSARVTSACEDGREVADLAATVVPGEPGSGLTLPQLRIVEARSELLVANLREVELTVPSPLLRRTLHIAAQHAGAVSDTVRTERELRLGSVTPDASLLESTARHLAAERAALDEALRDLSFVVAATP